MNQIPFPNPMPALPAEWEDYLPQAEEDQLKLLRHAHDFVGKQAHNRSGVPKLLGDMQVFLGEFWAQLEPSQRHTFLTVYFRLMPALAEMIDFDEPHEDADALEAAMEGEDLVRVPQMAETPQAASQGVSQGVSGPISGPVIPEQQGEARARALLKAQGITLKPGEPLFYQGRKDWQKHEMGENRREANRLVRIRVQNMNPAKKEWPGEIISVGSTKLGTFKKYVPYGTDEPYHVPWIIYQEMKERRCRIIVSRPGPNGIPKIENKLINEFAIEVLDPLTDQELKELARRQAFAEGREAG